MDNGFSITGTSFKYIRKSGSNSNSGDTTALPKLTITNNITANTIVLAGHYKEDPVLTAPGSSIQADGLVTIEGINPTTSVITGSYAAVSINDCVLINYNSINGNTGTINLNRCKLKSIINISNNTSTAILNFCEVIDSGAVGGRYIQSILKNYTANFVIAGSYITQSVVQPDCSITLNATALTNFKASFIQNNFRGVVIYSGNTYVVPQAVDLTGGGTGVVSFASRTGSYPAGATDWIHNLFSITPTVCYITNANYNADPLFRDAINNDFSVSTSSPCIGKIPTQVGRLSNTGYVQVTNQLLDFSTWTLTNITNTSGIFTITSGTTGSLVSPVITINTSVARALGELNLNGSFFYNVAVAGGTVDVNEQVPIIKTYTKQGSTITNNSPRLCLKMRLSTKNTTPSATTDADWDNNSYSGLNAGDWFIVEFKKPPKIDQNGFGNASDSYDVVNNGFPMGKYVQFTIELYNNHTQG
jgi:hypothetical protein